MQTVAPFLKQLLLEAGSLLLKHYGKVKSITYKAGSATNLVTNVDREVENFIKKRIRTAFPDDSILAEESPLERPDAARRWIIDPIDGTTNFAHALPLFCISIGVEEGGELVTGGVYDPVHDELFFAQKGKASTLNGKKIGVSRAPTLARSLLVTGFPYDIHTHPERSLPYFNALIQKGQGMRRLGSAALDLCYVAMSRFDGFFEVELNPWDTSAGVLIVQGAGGTVTDFDGRPYSIYGSEMAASNGLIHQEMLEVLQLVKYGSLKKEFRR